MAPTLEVAFSLIDSQLKGEKIIAIYESLVDHTKVLEILFQGKS
jgi:hypothetical protein